MKTKHGPLSVLFFCACLLSATALFSRASDLFTYQGKLANAEGQALLGGQYRIGVRIWDVASGGTTPLWARKYQVPVVDGLFSLMIGSTGGDWNDPAPLTSSLKLAVSGTSRFLEITVMSDAGGVEKPEAQWQVLAPRQALGAVPYAFNGVPPGTVVPFAGAAIPDGWVRCDGTAYSATDVRYATLFSTLQTTYGNGGAGTFRVPDLRGRSVIGAGQGSGLTNRNLAQAVGAETHQLTTDQMPSHSHGVIDPGHSHGYYRGQTAGGSGAVASSSSTPSTLTTSSTTGITIQSSGGSQPHNNMQPSLAINYIIKL